MFGRQPVDLYADAIDAHKYKETLHRLDIGEKVGELVEGKTLERDVYPPMIKLCEDKIEDVHRAADDTERISVDEPSTLEGEPFRDYRYYKERERQACEEVFTSVDAVDEKRPDV